MGVETGLRASQDDPKQGLSNVQVRQDTLKGGVLIQAALVFLFPVLWSVGLNDHFSFLPGLFYSCCSCSSSQPILFSESEFSVDGPAELSPA